jgi:hypothetical protein
MVVSFWIGGKKMPNYTSTMLQKQACRMFYNFMLGMSCLLV